MRKHPNDPPACVECKHYFTGGDDGSHCYHDACSTFDPVYGRLPVLPTTARLSEQLCGSLGRLFEAKPEPGWWFTHGLTVFIVGTGIIAAAFAFGPDVLDFLKSGVLK